MTTTTNRETKTQIEMWQDSEGWTLNCADHDQCCEFDTKREALEFRSAPSNFCSDCADIVNRAN